MHTHQPVFLEAFVKHCFDQGLKLEDTAELFHCAHVKDLLASSPDFAAGFDQVLKSAGVSTTDQMGAFMPNTKGTMLGTALGAGIGALSGKFKALGRVPGMLRAGVGALAGGAAGHHIAAGQNTPPSIDTLGAYVPSWMPNGGVPTPGGAPAPRPSGGSSSIFSTPTGMEASGSPSTATSPMGGSLSGVLQSSQTQVKALDKAIADAQSQMQASLAKPGLEGSLGARHLRAQLAALQAQRHQALNSSNSMLGHMYGDQRRSLSSIDDALSKTTGAISQMAPRADAMDAWYRNHPNQGFLSRMFGSLTGADNQAEQMQSRMQAARAHEAQLRQQQQAMQKALIPSM